MIAKSQQTSVVRPISQSSIGRNVAVIDRMIQLSSSDLIRPFRKIGIRAGHERDREQGDADQGEGLGVGQRVEQLPLAAGQGEHRQEREDRDQDRIEDRPADRAGRPG